MDNLIQMCINLNQKLIEEINIGLPIFIKQYLILKFAIICLIFLLELLFLLLIKASSIIYGKIKFKLVTKPSILILIYKLYLKIHNLTYSIRVKHYGRSNQEKDLGYYIYKDSFITNIKELMKGIFNIKDISSMIAIMLTILFYYESEVGYLVSSDLQIVSKEDSILILTMIPVIITILGIIIGLRYIGLKGRIERGTNRLNQKIIEEILDIHRRLSRVLIIIVDKGAKNIENALKSRNLLIQGRLTEISPLIEDIEDNKVIWKRKSLYKDFYKINMFEDIEEISQLDDLLQEAKQNGIYREMFWIGYYRKDMLGIKKHLYWDIEGLKKRFQYDLFTPYTLKNLLKDDRDEIIYNEIQNQIPEDEDNRRYYENEILKDMEKFEKRIDNILINSIEMLVDLSLYHKSIYKLLHFNSNKLGRALAASVDKE